jgi:hypothetical protein
MATVAYYYNKQDFPISFNFKGCRFTLWNRGDKVLDAEGNPIIDQALSHPDIVSLGLAAMTADELTAGQKPRPTPVVPRTPVPTPTPTPTPTPGLSDPPPLGNSAPAPTPIAEAPKVALPPQEKQAFIQKDKLTEADLADPKRLVCVQEAGMWVFRLNNYENASPAGIKAHIRTVFGKDVLERVKFEA